MLLSFVPADEYSLVLALNSDLQEIDLSSLETIRGAGIVFFNNPELCYTGDLSIYLEDSSYHQCVNDGRRKDTTTCRELFFSMKK